MLGPCLMEIIITSLTFFLYHFQLFCDALYQLRCCPTVAWIMHTLYRSPLNLRSTFSKCHVLFRYMH